MTTTVIRDFEGVFRLRATWTQLQRNPNSDFDQYLLVCEQRSCTPFVILVENDGMPTAILAGRKERSEFAPSLGYARPLRVPTQQLMLIHGGLLGDVDEGIGAALLECLRISLVNGEFDLVEICNYPENSPLLRAARNGWLAGILRERVPSWSTHRDMAFPKKPGELLQRISSKHRSWIRRKLRDLDKDFTGRWDYQAFSGGDLTQLCEELERVAKLTYQRSLGAGFIHDAENLARLRVFHDRGALRAWTLRIDGVPRAYAIGIVYRDTFHFSATGFDPNFRDQEVGTLIFVHMVDSLTEEGLALFDFGLGDAPYKLRFADRAWREGSYRLFRLSMKGFFIKAVSDVIRFATDAGHKLGGRLGMVNKVKTAWRKRLAQRQSTGSSDQVKAVRSERLV